MLQETVHCDKIRKEIERLHQNVEGITMPELKVFIDNLIGSKYCNVKSKFYHELYENIVRQSTIYWSINYSAGTVLARRVLQNPSCLCKEARKRSEIGSIKIKNLNDREYCGMQYLAGYVVHKLYLKHRNLKYYKTKTNQQTMTLLKACQLDPAKQIHAKLVKALTRGGLWCVNEHVEKIFLISEKYFSIKTDVSKRSIDIFSLVKSVMEYIPVKNVMESVIESIPDAQIEKEIVKITLYNMITLYMRVRAFSLARDIVQKEKIVKREKGKVNSLRKSLKKIR